ncbi:hypothetical protein [Peptoniphilus indolicus]|nr:hypothetical protein [Peptoniphilus indolicus]
MLVLISCSGKNNENLVDDFLTTYFNQANYSETEWQKIEEIISSKDSHKVLEPFKEFLTDKALDKFVNSRVIPCFYLKDMNISYKIGSFEKSDDGLTVELVLNSNDKTISFPLKFQFKDGKINWFDYATLMKNIQQLKKQSV